MSVLKKPSLIVSFVRSQMVAVLATAVDFIVFFGLTEILNVHYLIANIIGPICGGITGFLLGKYWAFVSKDAKTSNQALKYFAVMGVSMLLNVGGLYIFVENFGIEQQISKVIVAITVGIGFNFTLHRYFVFK